MTRAATRRRFFRDPAGPVCGRGAWPQRRVALDPGQPVNVQRKYSVSDCVRPKSIELDKHKSAPVETMDCCNACAQSRPRASDSSHCGDWARHLSIIPCWARAATHSLFYCATSARPCGSVAAGVYMQIRLMRDRERKSLLRSPLIALKRLCGTQQILQLVLGVLQIQ